VFLGDKSFLAANILFCWMELISSILSFTDSVNKENENLAFGTNMTNL